MIQVPVTAVLAPRGAGHAATARARWRAGMLILAAPPAAHKQGIPCHRVVRATGRLTGYVGGLNRERALLETEEAGAMRAGHALVAGLR